MPHHDGRPAWESQALEELLCRTLGCADFDAYLARLAGDVPQPCTNVWQAGAIAYRCVDCQTVPHSAICVECFQVRLKVASDIVLQGVSSAWLQLQKTCLSPPCKGSMSAIP